jgi:hypothetical protein
MAQVRALVGCQHEDCAGEVSYHLDMVRVWKEKPICQVCYEDGDYGERNEDGDLIQSWSDLPLVILADLSE